MDGTAASQGAEDNEEKREKMKVGLKLVIDIDAKTDSDGDTIGVREAIAAAIESYGRVRFVDTLTGRRLTARDEGGVRYNGECDYIPCNKKGACLDGYACEGCAFADLLKRAAVYEDALMRK